MFAKLTHRSVCFATLALMSACGGGDHAGSLQGPGNPALSGPAFTTGADALAAGWNAAGADAANGAIDQPQVMTAATVESTTVTMHGASASVLGAADLAGEQERLAYEQSQIDYEQSYSIELNRRHEEQITREKAGETALQDAGAIGAECQQASGELCPKVDG